MSLVNVNLINYELPTNTTSFCCVQSKLSKMATNVNLNNPLLTNVNMGGNKNFVGVGIATQNAIIARSCNNLKSNLKVSMKTNLSENKLINKYLVQKDLKNTKHLTSADTLKYVGKKTLHRTSNRLLQFDLKSKINVTKSLLQSFENDNINPESQKIKKTEDEFLENKADNFIDMNVLCDDFRSSIQITQFKAPYFASANIENKSNLKELKMKFVRDVSASLVSGANLSDPESDIRIAISKQVHELAELDPEFVLKVAVYTRLELNIRSLANFLLALAAHEEKCRPYQEKYFGCATRLPSDWLEVAEFYRSIVEYKRSFPAALRRAMVAKFPEFNEYQLAKYNKTKTNKKNKGKKVTTNEDKSSFAYVTAPVKRKSMEKPPPLTMKELIRRFHISKPSEHVMAIVGKKYPTSLAEFWSSGLSGMWQPEMSAKRMKLAVPETWETQLALKGSKAETWQQLLDNKKLPFMAMLRNLRNLILADLEEKYHNIIIGILTNERSVLQSRQFPFRFLSAFEVVNGLENLLTTTVEKLRFPNKRTPQELAKNAMLRKKQKKLNKLKEKNMTSLIEKYKLALNKSIEISTTHNVPPIQGNTIVFCDLSVSLYHECPETKGLGISTTARSAALLLGVMCKYACENCTLVVFGTKKAIVVNMTRGNQILKEVNTLMDYTKILETDKYNVINAFTGGRIICKDLTDTNPNWFPVSLLYDQLKGKKWVDNVIVLSHDKIFDSIPSFLEKYRAFINPNLLFVSVDVVKSRSSSQRENQSNHPRDVFLSGFSDQLLIFIAEGGSNRQLQYIEEIDKKYKLKNLLKVVNKVNDKSTLSPTIRTPRWRTVRVFISSTFRDMHAERDLLVRSVFPELRSRALSLCVDVHDVDLRWGITEEEANENKTLEICLREAARCDMFVGLLGERYGTIPNINNIPQEKEFDWVREYSPGASITELEFYVGALANSERQASRSIICIRDNSFQNTVPQEYLHYFLPENDDHKSRLEKLKSRVRFSNLSVYDGYPCTWGGVKNGVPVVDGLENFAETVIEKLWIALQNTYSSDDDFETKMIDSESSLHESFANRRVESFIGRKEIIEQCIALIKEGQQLILITGKSGSGKTSVMAKLYQIIKNGNPMVISYFTGVDGTTKNVNKLVKYLCDEISSKIENENQVHTENNISRLHLLLDSMKHSSRKLILLLDGLDEFPGDSLSSWLPNCNLENVIMIFSATEYSSVLKTLTQRNSSVIRLTPMSFLERKELVKSTLEPYRKVLSESPRDNQLRILISKSDAGRPLFLVFACDEIRLFWIFEKVSEKLRKISNTTSGLINGMILNLEETFGRSRVEIIFQLLLLVDGGLSEKELHHLLNLCFYFKNRGDAQFDNICQCARRINLIPRSWFAIFFRSLHTFLHLSQQQITTDEILNLSHQEIFQLISQRYSTMNKMLFYKCLAAYFYTEADPRQDHSWVGKNPRAFERVVDYLIRAECLNKAEQCLTNLKFLVSKVNLVSIEQLLQDFNLFNNSRKEDYIESDRFKDYSEFVLRQNSLLKKSPSMLFQQALNNLSESFVTEDAQAIAKTEVVTNVLQYCNKPDEADICLHTWSTADAVNCISLSSCQKLLAAGLSNGQIYIFDLVDHKVIHVLSAQISDITSVSFLKSNGVVSSSADGSLSLWDVQSGNCLATVMGHDRKATCCCCSSDGTAIISVGWDCALRVWSTKLGKEISVLKFKNQINSCSLHPHRDVVAIGLWDGTVRIVDLITIKQIALFRGHECSVTCVDYSKCGMYVASGSLNGEVIIWSSSHGFQISAFKASNLRINDICFNINSTGLFTVAGDHVVKFWSGIFYNEKFLTEIDGNIGIKAIASNDEYDQELIVAYNNSTIIKVNAKTGQILFSVKPSNSEITCLRFDKYIAVGYYNDKSVLLDINTGNKVSTLQGSYDSAICICFPWPNVVVCGCMDGSLITHNIKSNTIKTFTNGHSDWITSLSVNVYSKLCASVSRDKSLKIWNTYESGKISLLSSMDHCHNDWITCCVWILKSECDSLLTGSNDNTIKQWNFKNNNLTANGIFATMLSPIAYLNVKDGCVVAGSINGNIKIFTINGLNVVSVECGLTRCYDVRHVSNTTMTVKDWYEEVVMEEEKSEQICSKKKNWPSVLVFMESKGHVKCVKLFDEKKEKIMCGHSDTVTSIQILDSDNLISGSLDTTIRKWDQQQELKNKQIKAEIVAIVWNRNLELMITCSRDGSGQIWKPGIKFDNLIPVSDFKLPTSEISCACFTSNNKFLTGSTLGEINTWEILGNYKIEQRGELKFENPFLCCDFQETLNLAAFGGWNGKVYTLQVIHGQSGQKIKIAPDHWITQVKFTKVKDKFQLFVFSTQRQLVTFSFGKKVEVVHSFSTENFFPLCCSFSKFDYFIGCTDGALVNFNLEQDQTRSIHMLHNKSINCCQVDAKHQFLVTSSSDRFIKVWKLDKNLHVGPQIAQFECVSSVSTLSLRSSNEQLVIITGDNHGKIYYLKLLHKV